MSHRLEIRRGPGKYGLFCCPLCHHMSGYFKFSQVSGWCENCGKQFMLTDGGRVLHGNNISIAEVETG